MSQLLGPKIWSVKKVGLMAGLVVGACGREWRSDWRWWTILPSGSAESFLV